MDGKDFYDSEDYSVCLHVVNYEDCSLESDEPCDIQDLHDIAIPLAREYPQLFFSKRFYGFQRMEEQAKHTSMVENLWLHATQVVESNYWLDAEYMFPSIWIESFITNFNKKDDRTRVLLEDFRVTDKEATEKVKILAEAIFSRATWNINSDYTPIPTFLVIMLIDYCVHFVPRHSTHNLRTYKQTKEDFVKISDYILSEATIPGSILHKLALGLNPYFAVGLDSNPSLTEEDKVLFSLNFGMRTPHEYSPLSNPIFNL